MWQSPNAGQTPDVKFLRTAGITLLVLTLFAGGVSLAGTFFVKSEPTLVVAEATTLERGAEAIFREVGEEVARRHEFSFETE